MTILSPNITVPWVGHSTDDMWMLNTITQYDEIFANFPAEHKY